MRGGENVLSLPSDEIIDEGNKTFTSEASDGRVFEVKRITMLERLNLAKVLSAENQSKQIYLNLCTLASAIVSIDGEKVMPLRSELAFDSLIQRMGQSGERAVEVAYLKFPEIDIDPKN